MSDRARRSALRALLASACGFAALTGCGTKEPIATFVEPVIANPCAAYDCSGHGTCQLSQGSGPSCACNAGFAGDRCERELCEAGSHWDSMHRCVPDQSCASQPSNPCGAHGTCDDGGGVVACRCDTGYDGPRCNLCSSGYGRNAFSECLLLTLATGDGGGGGGSGSAGSSLSSSPTSGAGCTADTCNRHGDCDDSGGTARCLCDAGYGGTGCASCATGFHADPSNACVMNEACAPGMCGAHGTCDNGTGSAVCTCEAGYAGMHCEACAASYHDEDAGAGACAMDQQCASDTCSSSGTCSVKQGLTSCACDAGYQGSHCERCTADHHRNASNACVLNETCSSGSCSGHGSCDASSGVVVCTCDGSHTGATCATCASGYHADGSGGCAADQHCQSDSCPTHATCADGTGLVVCTCADGYTGVSCTGCAPGYQQVSVGPVDFNSEIDFPASINNCLADVNPYVSTGMTFTSVGGDGTVWLCGPSSLYQLGSKHVALEAGTMFPAEIAFDAPITALSFDYAARLGPLMAQFLGDGKNLTTLSQINNGTGTLAFVFDPPISRFGVLSLSATTSQIALDNLSYESSNCEASH